jgi:hypothetical protein
VKEKQRNRYHIQLGYHYLIYLNPLQFNVVAESLQFNAVAESLQFMLSC